MRREGGDLLVWLRRRVADLAAAGEPVRFEACDALAIEVVARRAGYDFFAGPAGGGLVPVGSGSTQLLSTEVMRSTFTGCLFGLFAEGAAVMRVVRFAVSESAEQQKLNKSATKRGYAL